MYRRNALWFGVAATAAGMIFASRAGAVVPGQVDTFSDGADGWGGGGASNVGGGGPAGAADPYLSVDANGGNGPASKLITYNRGQWVGDYTTAGVDQITVDLKDFSAAPLSIRIVFKDSTSQGSGGYATTNAYVVPADGAWHHATFAVSSAAMTPINSPAESFASLIGPGGALAEFRILDSASPSIVGDTIAATLGLDNVTAASSGPPSVSATWNDGSGNWEDGTKWVGGTPASGAGQTATFLDPTGGSSATVTLTASKVIGTLAFNAASGGAYTLAATGGSTLSLNGSGGAIRLLSTAGNVSVSAPLVFNTTVTATTDGATTLTIAGGLTGTGGLIKAGTGTVAFAAPAAGAGLVVSNLSSLSITAGVVALKSTASRADRTLLTAGGLSVTGGQLDLGGNDADFQNVSLTTVQALLKTGYNGGAWNGPGPSIVSTLAAADASHLSGVGAITGVTTFDGRAVLATDVVAKYTYNGDANLDGKVDGSDYTRIDSGFLSHATGWFNGDFNYDNAVDGGDYSLIDNAYNRQRASLSPTALFATPAAGPTAVPEPAAILISLPALGLLRRRRRSAALPPCH